MMKARWRWIWVAGLAVGGVGAVLAMRDEHPGPGVAVVELFTSEGCSSCPPADALVAKLVKEGSARVYPVSFHVDYWNTEQWKDAYSDARYSQRQQGYAKVAGAGNVYTPQMIVNGETGFVGSDEETARRQIALALKQKPRVSVTVNAKVEGTSVSVNCTCDALAGKTLNVALVERGIHRKIGAGENAGRALMHENVVREFESVKISGGTSKVILNLPPDCLPANCSVVAYVQDDLMHVLGANAAELSATTPQK